MPCPVPRSGAHFFQLLFSLVERVDYPVELLDVGTADFQELLAELIVPDARDVDYTKEVCC